MDREAEAYGPLKSAVKAFGAEHERWKALVRQNEGRNRALLAKRNQSLGIPDLGAEAERAARARSEELARKVDDECKAELCRNLGDAVIRRRSVLACW
jgi:hypothetical protein